MSFSQQQFTEGFHSGERVQGLTHDFYKYPARFSPSFVRFVLDELSVPGDWVLDPFMGGGTTVVEALASGRRAIGSDINELAHFVSRVKTTPLSNQDITEVFAWVESVKRLAPLCSVDGRSSRNLVLQPRFRWTEEKEKKPGVEMA